MKKTKLLFVLGIFLLGFMVILSSCKKDEEEPPPPVTKVVGTAQFPAGTSGDLSNSKVSLYTSYDNWENNVPIKYAAVSGSGASVTFEISNVLPGNYWLDVWKDIDNNAVWSINDYVGWYGSGGLGSWSLTEFQITEGQTFSCSVNMYIFAKGSGFPK